MAEVVKARLPHLPDDDRLIQQLSARQYSPTVDGRIKVESKEEFKKRVQDGSPDRADAMVLTFYDRFQGGAKVAVRKQKPRAKIVRSTY